MPSAPGPASRMHCNTSTARVRVRSRRPRRPAVRTPPQASQPPSMLDHASKYASPTRVARERMWRLGVGWLLSRLRMPERAVVVLRPEGQLRRSVRTRSASLRHLAKHLQKSDESAIPLTEAAGVQPQRPLVSFIENAALPRRDCERRSRGRPNRLSAAALSLNPCRSRRHPGGIGLEAFIALPKRDGEESRYCQVVGEVPGLPFDFRDSRYGTGFMHRESSAGGLPGLRGVGSKPSGKPAQ